MIIRDREIFVRAFISDKVTVITTVYHEQERRLSVEEMTEQAMTNFKEAGLEIGSNVKMTFQST